MTNEEAIERLKDMDNVYNQLSIEDKEAIDMAIAALRLIPDNATNGDVIMSLFPITEINAMLVTIFCTLEDGTELEFKRKWWFSPYKGHKGDTE